MPSHLLKIFWLRFTAQCGNNFILSFAPASPVNHMAHKKANPLCHTRDMAHFTAFAQCITRFYFSKGMVKFCFAPLHFIMPSTSYPCHDALVPLSRHTYKPRHGIHILVTAYTSLSRHEHSTHTARHTHCTHIAPAHVPVSVSILESHVAQHFNVAFPKLAHVSIIRYLAKIKAVFSLGRSCQGHSETPSPASEKNSQSDCYSFFFAPRYFRHWAPLASPDYAPGAYRLISVMLIFLVKKKGRLGIRAGVF